MIDATILLRGYAKLRATRRRRKPAAKQQLDTLRRLVARAEHTRFGRDHDFAGVRTVADFQARVPLRSYEDFFSTYMEETFPILDDVCWPGRIPYFAVSSGTSSGRTKYIPVSRDMLRSNSRAGTDLLAHHVRNCPESDVLGGKSFMLGGSVALEDLGSGVRSGDLSGIARLNNPRWSEPFVFPDLKDALDADWEHKIERLARLSLKEPIRCIAGTPSWLLVFFEHLRDITGGQKVRNFYPKLDLMVYGGMSFAPYRETFAAWFPEHDDKVDWREVYSASEGFVASADAGIDDGMLLNTDIGLFFEFVPVEELDRPNPTRHVIGTAPPGEYALILSTCAGLWAHKIGDVVELLPGEPPRVRVTGRTAYYMSAFGEHLSGSEIESALLTAARKGAAAVSEFSVTPIYPDTDERRGRHLFVVELTAPLSEDAARRFAKNLDDALASENEDYEAHRKGDLQLMAPDVAFVPPGAFADWMRSRGKLGGQNKVPRVVMSGDVRQSLLNFARTRRV
ncbi:MAG: GH3 auxin-responsive promoter family protein [Pseudomonadota bacterium]